MKPGSFDMAAHRRDRNPGDRLLPDPAGAVPALDAWETMVPTAQRMADLLDGVVLDEERNALGRQRIQHIRDELRAYDRQQQQSDAEQPTR